MHGLARRQAGAQLPRPGIPGRGPRGHHAPGAGLRRQTASDAAGVPRRPGVPVRLLRRGDDHDVGEPLRRAEEGPPFHLKGNLCRCTGYHSIEDAIRGIASVEEDRAGHACGASLANPRCRADRHRQRPLHDGRRDGGDASPQGRPLAARARHASRPSARTRRSPSRGSTPSSPGRTSRGGPSRRPATTTSASIPTTPTCSTTSRGSSASGSPPWSPKPRPPRRRAAGWWRWTTRCFPPSSTPRRPCFPAPADPRRQGRRVPDRGAGAQRVQEDRGRDRRCGRGIRRGGRVYEGTYSLPKIQHAHMETHGSIAWRTAGRAHPRPHQHPGPSPHQDQARVPVPDVSATRSTSSPNSSGAGSAASRRCSPRTCASWRRSRPDAR